MGRGKHVKATDEIRMAQRRSKVAELYLRGTTQHQVAEALGVSVATVAKDLQECRRIWREKAAEAFEQKKDEELAKIDNLERIALLAWERSCVDREVIVTKKESVIQAPPKARKGQHQLVPIRETVEKQVSGQSGDPRFLDQVAWCIETRLKIMGVYKDDKSGQTMVTINWGDILLSPPAERVVGDHSSASQGKIVYDPIEEEIRKISNQAGIQQGVSDDEREFERGRTDGLGGTEG